MNGDVTALPLAAGVADVVVAGEILEHVTDLPGTVAELCRVLRPGGLVVLDTVNDTALSRFVTVTAAERLGIAPVGLHDPALFVATAPADRGVRPARRTPDRPRRPPERDRPGPLAGPAGGAAPAAAIVPTRLDRGALPGHRPQGGHSQ